MSCNFGEIIKKLNFPCLVESPPEGYPRHPQPLCEPLPHIFHVLDGKCEPASARFTCENHSREGGEGGVICKTVPFNNWSSDRLQTQNQDSQYYSAPLLFRQDLSNSFWWLMASFGEFIYWREAIKGSRSQWPALSRLHHSQQATPLWRKEVGHSNTRGTVRLCSFPLKLLLHIVYIFNILCGIKVINSRHLQ